MDFMSEFNHRCKCLSLLGLHRSYFKESRRGVHKRFQADQLDWKSSLDFW